MPRASYHHGDLRAALLDAAVALVEERGAEGVHLREVARAVGVSSAAPYRHFADRDALMSAVAAVGHQRLMAAMDAATAGIDSPLLRYRMRGVAVVTFAVASPALFRVMHTAAWASPEASPEMAAARAALDASTAALVAQARQAGELAAEPTAVQTLAAEALVYGLARLFVDGHLSAGGVGDDQAGPLAAAVLDVLGQGLAAR